MLDRLCARWSPAVAPGLSDVKVHLHLKNPSELRKNFSRNEFHACVSIELVSTFQCNQILCEEISLRLEVENFQLF